MDNELFELCKQVYEKTGLGENLQRYEDGKGVPYRNIPLYTSDYLLEKLPLRIGRGCWLTLCPLDSAKREWEVGYYNLTKNFNIYVRYANTPLKALLLLTLALSEAGEL